MPFQAGGRGGEDLADEISARVQTELGGAPRGVGELLGVELGGVQLRGCLDAIDEGGRAVAEAELAARVEQAGELAGLDVTRVFPDQVRGGGEQRIDARGGGAGERAAAVGDFARRWSAVPQLTTLNSSTWRSTRSSTSEASAQRASCWLSST